MKIKTLSKKGIFCLTLFLQIPAFTPSLSHPLLGLATFGRPKKDQEFFSVEKIIISLLLTKKITYLLKALIKTISLFKAGCDMKD
jgi:hypothetical protein